jgi:YfiH family protein
LFYKDERNIYHARPLDEFPWLVHGFATRWNESFGSCHNLATLKQIHSDRCVDAAGRHGVLGEGDALFENTPGVVVGVKTADCVPVLLVDERNRAVAAVHAGWRGSAQEIASKAVGAMKDRFGTRPEDLHAAIGPAISSCCFEVGPEVAAQFGKNVPGKTKLDLIAINRGQLLAAGLAEDRIYSADLCTFCMDEFHSFRRDREKAGRMLSVVGIAANHT